MILRVDNITCSFTGFVESPIRDLPVLFMATVPPGEDDKPFEFLSHRARAKPLGTTTSAKCNAPADLVVPITKKNKHYDPPSNLNEEDSEKREFSGLGSSS